MRFMKINKETKRRTEGRTEVVKSARKRNGRKKQIGTLCLCVGVCVCLSLSVSVSACLCVSV